MSHLKSHIQATNVNINLRHPVVFKHCRSNVELDSTALCPVPGPIELKSTCYFAVLFVDFTSVGVVKWLRLNFEDQRFHGKLIWTRLFELNLDSKGLIYVIDWFQTLPLRGSSCSHYPLHRILSVYHVFSLINLVSFLSI
jgi:hypothetical protein